jgi:hypothetical protein
MLPETKSRMKRGAIWATAIVAVAFVALILPMIFFTDTGAPPATYISYPGMIVLQPGYRASLLLLRLDPVRATTTTFLVLAEAINVIVNWLFYFALAYLVMRFRARRRPARGA